jgi:hypothetical protein
VAERSIGCAEIGRDGGEVVEVAVVVDQDGVVVAGHAGDDQVGDGFAVHAGGQ